MTVLRDARVLLAVTGGIAAHKGVDLASKLVQAGVRVDAILTESGSRFVGPAALQAITKRPVHSSIFEDWTSDWFGHISLGQNTDVLVVAPATANTLARLAHGLADDMLGAVALTTTAPLILAPAMEHTMFHHSATQQNLSILRDRGAFIVGPESGRLASGEIGDGRLSEPETIMGAIRSVLGRQGPLAGTHIVVTAGGTQEPLDLVRFVGNRSSGRMGFAIAQAAIDAGAAVTLIAGPTSLTAPYGSTYIAVNTAIEMKGAVDPALKGADALVMAAAVADYRPSDPRQEKVKKSQAGESLNTEFVANPDILASAQGNGLLKIGFAAETSNLIENAWAKIGQKGLDLIIANDAQSSIGSRDTTVTLVWPNGSIESLPRMRKEELAEILICRITDLLQRH